MDGMIVAALLVAGLALIPFGFGGGDQDDESDDVGDEEVVTPEDPDPPEEPELGVSFLENENGIRIEVDEDETGSVVAIRTEMDLRSSEDSRGDSGTGTNFGVRFYLVPEGVDFPPSVDTVLETLAADQQALAVEGQDGPSIPVETYLTNLGAEEIGRIDLGQVVRSDRYTLASPELAVDTREDSIAITSNRDIATYEIDVDNRWRADPLDGTVAGDALTEIDADRLTTPDVYPTDCTVTFEDDVISFALDEDVDGQVVAVLDIVENAQGGSSTITTHDIKFYLLPEGAPFPVSVNEMIEDAPLNSVLRDGIPFEEDGTVRGTPYLEVDQYMHSAGAAFLASIPIGSIFHLDPDGDGTFDDRDTVNRDFIIEANRPYITFQTSAHGSGEPSIADIDTPPLAEGLLGFTATDSLIPPPAST